MIAFLIALPRLPFYVRARRPLHVLLALTLLFCFGTGLLTALKRINFGIVQAFSSRYQTVSLLFWCCMALLLLSKLSSLSKFHLLALQVVLLAVMLFAAYRTPSGLNEGETARLRD